MNRGVALVREERSDHLTPPTTEGKNDMEFDLFPYPSLVDRFDQALQLVIRPSTSPVV